jgi:hypothetical protein
VIKRRNAILEKALDRPVTGVAVPRETWVDTLAQHGMPADRSGAYIEMIDSFNSRWIDFGVPGTEHVKGTIDLVTAVNQETQRSLIKDRRNYTLKQRTRLFSLGVCPSGAFFCSLQP